jgi:hypothetical protein
MREKMRLQKLIVWLIVLTVFTGFSLRSTAQDDTESLARLIPNTANLYMELATDDVEGTLIQGLTMLSTVAPALDLNIPIEPNMILQLLDLELSRVLMYNFSIENDVLSWLGDKVAISTEYIDGYSILSGDTLFVAEIKNRDRAIRFLEDIFQLEVLNLPPVTRFDDEINGEPIAIFSVSIEDYYRTIPFAIVVTTDTLMIGTNQSIANTYDVLRGSNPSLATDTGFSQLIGTLRPNSTAKLYINSRALLTLNEFDSEYMPQSWKSLLGDINGVAMGISADNTAWVLELLSDIPPSALSNVISYIPDFNINPTTTSISSQVPDRTMAIMMWSDISGIFQFVRETTPNLAPLLAPLSGASEREFESFIYQYFEMLDEEASYYGINLDDFLSWIDGEFATYLYFNPQSDLRCESEYFLFDQGFILNIEDRLRATFGITAFNNFITSGYYNRDEYTTIENGIFALESGWNGSQVIWGMLDNNVVINNGSALPHIRSTINGTSPSLATNPIWIRANSDFPSSGRLPILFINLLEVQNALNLLNLNDRDVRDVQALIGLTEPFESASLYADELGNGVSRITGKLYLKQWDASAIEPLPDLDSISCRN